MSDDVELHGRHTQLRIRRPARGVILLDVVGRDTGELGNAPFHELDRALAGEEHPELFIDASQAVGPALDVSAAWAQWLGKNRERYTRVSMLTGSAFVTLTVDFVKRFAALGDQMRIYTDAVAFGTAFRLACDAAGR
jgi:hypothetical protein